MSDSSDDARTEAPSKQRIARFRRAGDVLQSRDLVAASAAAAGCAVLVVGGKIGAGGLLAYVRLALDSAVGGQPPWQAIRSGLAAAITASGLPLGIVCAVAIVVALAQTQGNLATGAIVPDGARLVPRVRRILRRETAVDAIFDGCKLALLAMVVCGALSPWFPAVARTCGVDAARLLAVVGGAAERLGLHLVIAMLGIALADYLLQGRRYQARLRLSRPQARREERAEEGAFEPKAERHRLHQEWLTNDGWRLREATLVLVDPARVAIAIAYSGQAHAVPRLILRQERLLVPGLEAAARVAGIPVFLDPILVRSLSRIEPGDEIPAASYAPIAALITRVWRLPRTSGQLPAQPTPSGKPTSSTGPSDP